MKPNQKNKSEEGIWTRRYLYTIYLLINKLYRQHLKITSKLCTVVRLEVGGLSHGTLLPLTLKTSLNVNLVNIG